MRWEDPERLAVGQFCARVARPISIAALAEQLGCTTDEAENRAGALAAAQGLLTLRSDGHIILVGWPLRPGEEPAYKAERKSREERECRLREKERIRKRRRRPGQRARRRAREVAAAAEVSRDSSDG